MMLRKRVIYEAKKISSDRFVTLDDGTMGLLRLQKAEFSKISPSLEHIMKDVYLYRLLGVKWAKYHQDSG